MLKRHPRYMAAAHILNIEIMKVSGKVEIE
jgi:hypothetical protein